MKRSDCRFDKSGSCRKLQPGKSCNPAKATTKKARQAKRGENRELRKSGVPAKARKGRACQQKTREEGRPEKKQRTRTDTHNGENAKQRTTVPAISSDWRGEGFVPELRVKDHRSLTTNHRSLTTNHRSLTTKTAPAAKTNDEKTSLPTRQETSR
jgi:hypothetical protein